MPSPKRTVNLALLINEFFDPTLRMNSALGGYGMLARHYIAQHLPNPNLSITTILGFSDKDEFETRVVDGCKPVVLLPGRRRFPRLMGVPNPLAFGALFRRAQHIRKVREYLKQFDAFLSIETMEHTPDMLDLASDKTLVLYIQDPRPETDWAELDSAPGTNDGSPRPSNRVRGFYRRLVNEDRLLAISQGADLVSKARTLYHLPEHLPIRVVRNPVVVDPTFDLTAQAKEDAVLFLGRLDPVKRPWIALEVAKRMPHVQFYFLGKIQSELSLPYIQEYLDAALPNVHLLGHQEGSVKVDLLKRCKVLINTSIHEAIPVSFLEALAYGTLIVSCQNPDSITSTFGVDTGKVLGDGRDRSDAFVNGIQHLLDNDEARRSMAEEARAYVSRAHSLESWVEGMRAVIFEAAGRSKANDVATVG